MNNDLRRAALRAGLEALSLSAAGALLDRLLGYLDLLHKWNQVYNLSAVRDPQQMVHQHLLDCLAALPPLDRHLQGSAMRASSTWAAAPACPGWCGP